MLFEYHQNMPWELWHVFYVRWRWSSASIISDETGARSVAVVLFVSMEESDAAARSVVHRLERHCGTDIS